MSARTPRYIPQRSLSQLKTYSYKGVDKSITSKYILNPFWTKFVTIWPTWVAPNTITFIGLCTVFFNFATLIYYDPAYLTEKGGATGPPQWVYYTWAAGLFFYQSMDAIDGKQARRTGMAGPLGEMFDHGCDAINTTLELILCQRALNLGRSWWTVASMVASLMNFYLTTWEEYHTGQLYLGVFSGPVEGIIMIVVLYIITGYYGTVFWDQGTLAFIGVKKLPILANLPDMPLNGAFMVFAGVGLAFNILTSYSNVYKACKAANKSVTKPLAYLLPFVFTVGLYLSWLTPWQPVPLPDGSVNSLDVDATLAQKTTPAPPGLESILNSELFVPFLCSWGLQFAHQVGKMILAHVTKGRFPVWDWMWVWLSVCALDWNARTLFERAPLIQTSPDRTRALIYVTLVLTIASYVRFCTFVIGDITNYLGIACFTVRKKDEHGEWVDAGDVNAKKKQ
ncbi:hypothetical protein AURDEDRAFT_114773 [Auricularia subglabra TFB-10046 SS5]|nr:hypothetical protein AURDEDRAFT_114773 [Auricularia subglabra TFB-10046 SS5]